MKNMKKLLTAATLGLSIFVSQLLHADGGGAFVGGMAGSMVGSTIANSGNRPAPAPVVVQAAPVAATDSNLMYIMIFLGGLAVLGLVMYLVTQSMKKN